MITEYKMEDIVRIRELVDHAICPVCNKSCGNLHPRLSMMSHLRRSKEKRHVLFKEAFWKVLFPVGYRKAASEPPTIEERIHSLISLYGKEQCQVAMQGA
jgi:hypothetical protein